MALDMQSIYLLASGGSRAMEQLDTTTNNIANVDTTGFKKMMIEEMSQRIDQNGLDSNHLFVFPRFKQSLIFEEQGALKQTGVPLDLAIEGKGFFVIQKGTQQLLSRDGHFFISPDGFLVNKDGNRVLDKEGQPIALENNQVTITSDGKIYQQGEEVASFQIVDYDKVTPVGANYYQPSGAKRAAKFTLYQGYLESSNVNPVLEMTSLITAQRRFEIYNNLIKSIDQLNQKTNEIAKA